MSDILEAVDKAIEAIRRARRTLIVHPDDYGPVTARIYADGMSSMVQVQQDSHVQPGTLILVDHPTVDASLSRCVCHDPWGNLISRWCPVHGQKHRDLYHVTGAPPITVSCPQVRLSNSSA